MQGLGSNRSLTQAWRIGEATLCHWTSHYQCWIISLWSLLARWLNFSALIAAMYSLSVTRSRWCKGSTSAGFQNVLHSEDQMRQDWCWKWRVRVRLWAFFFGRFLEAAFKRQRVVERLHGVNTCALMDITKALPYLFTCLNSVGLSWAIIKGEKREFKNGR